MGRSFYLVVLMTYALPLAFAPKVARAASGPSACTSSILRLTLEPNSIPECQQFELEGRFTLDLCLSGTGLLISETAIVRNLEKTRTDWISRREWKDLRSKDLTSEIFVLPDDLSGFALSRVVSNQKHELVGKVYCEGRIAIEN